MEKFAEDIQKLLIKTMDDKNKWAYNTLLMYCYFHDNYLKNPFLIFDEDFIKALYAKFNFGGVQKDKDFIIEKENFINSYITLVDIINIFYSNKIKHIDIIELNIDKISKNTEKPYKSGLIDFLNNLNLYNDITKYGLKDYFDIIYKNKLFFIILFNYDKDILQNYDDACKEYITPHIKYYKDASLPLLWMIQKLLSSHHIQCVEKMMYKLFNNYVYIINSDFIKALLILFTKDIKEHHAKIYVMFLNKFITEYGESYIEDIELNECKINESHVEICPNNNVIRICDNIPEKKKVDPSIYCNMKTNNKFLKMLYKKI